jgi:deoxycytidine triphosphate deaminase
MVLNDTEIETLATTVGSEMITDFKKTNLFNCGYNFRIGQIYEPGTGIEIIKDGCPGFKIPPNGTAVIRTKEKVKLPLNICASYSSPFKLAREGILLLNACMVEPGYEGFLSCYFVNFSSRDFCFTEDQNIAKIVFFKLQQNPTNTKTLKISDDDYKKILFEQSNKFQSSFLDIKGIEDRTHSSASKAVNSSIKWGGILVGLLLLFSSLEPLITKWLWGSSPVFDKKIDLLEKQVLRNSTILNVTEEGSKKIDSLYNVKINLLSKEIDSLKHHVK